MRVEIATKPSDRSASWVTSSARLARSGGSATVICLDGLRLALGARWPKLRETAIAQLEQLLRQRLGPSDTFVPLDDMNYLVIMPQSARDDGEIACLRIAYDLNRDLTGLCRLSQLTVTPATAIDDTIIEVDAFGAGELPMLVERAGLVLAPPEVQPIGSYDVIAPTPEAMQVVYQPVWDSELQVITSYRCRLADGLTIHGPQTSAERIRAVSLLSLTLLRHASVTLLQHLRQGERFRLVIPISFHMLSDPAARMQFLAVCRGLDTVLRSYFIFSVKELPPGVPQSRMTEIVTILQAFCGAVAAQAPHPVSASLPDYRTTGIKALGVSLKGLSPAACDFDIAALTGETRRRSLVSFAEYVDDASALASCLDRKVRWLWGAAVSPAVAEPGPLKRLSRMQLLKAAAA